LATNDASSIMSPKFKSNNKKNSLCFSDLHVPDLSKQWLAP
jgi:hypothetical protein